MTLYPITRPVATNSDGRAAELTPADLDPDTYPIIARHWFGIEPLRPVDQIAAEAVAGIRSGRWVEQPHERRTV